MNNNKTVPGYIYAGSAVTLMLIFIFLVLPNYGQPADELSITLPLIAAEAGCLVIALQIKKWKTDTNIVFDLYQALTIPCMVAILAQLLDRKWIYKGLFIAAILSALYMALIIWYNVILKCKINNKRYIQKCVCVSMYKIRATLCWSISFVLIVVIWRFLLSPTQMTVVPEEEVLKWSESRTIEANYDICSKIDEFQELSAEEKEEFVMCAADVITNYLCVPYKVSVRVKNIKGKAVANYTNSSRTITIDREYLDTSTGRDVLNSVCHEAYHSYQYALLDMSDRLNERDRAFLSSKLYYVDQYKKELLHYKTEGEEYANQEFEIQARIFAEEAVEDWLSKLEEIRDKNGLSQK